MKDLIKLVVCEENHYKIFGFININVIPEKIQVLRTFGYKNPYSILDRVNTDEIKFRLANEKDFIDFKLTEKEINRIKKNEIYIYEKCG